MDRLRKNLARTVLLATFIVSCSKLSGTGQKDAFSDGRNFLQGIRLNEHPEKIKVYRAFNAAGIPLPAALTAVLSGKPVVDDGIREARTAAARQIAGDHPSFRTAGVPAEIPMVERSSVAERLRMPNSHLALNDTLFDQKATANVDAGNGAGGGAGGNEQCKEVNASCYAFAAASASAFACAYASAWACVFAEVPPFRQLCTWAYSEACVSSMSVAFAAAYSTVSVNVCTSCPGGGGNDTGGIGGGSTPSPSVRPTNQPTGIE